MCAYGNEPYDVDEPFPRGRRRLPRAGRRGSSRPRGTSPSALVGRRVVDRRAARRGRRSAETSATVRRLQAVSCLPGRLRPRTPSSRCPAPLHAVSADAPRGRVEAQRRPADRRHVARSGRVLDAVAAVTGGHGDRDPRVVERGVGRVSVETRRRRSCCEMTVAPCAGGAVHRGRRGRRRRRAASTSRILQLGQIARDLSTSSEISMRPAGVGARRLASPFWPIFRSSRSPSCRRGGRLAAVHREVRLGGRVVVGVDDRDRLRVRRRGGQLVRGVELLRRQAGRRRRRVRGALRCR